EAVRHLVADLIELGNARFEHADVAIEGEARLVAEDRRFEEAGSLRRAQIAVALRGGEPARDDRRVRRAEIAPRIHSRRGPDRARHEEGMLIDELLEGGARHQIALRILHLQAISQGVRELASLRVRAIGDELLADLLLRLLERQDVLPLARLHLLGREELEAGIDGDSGAPVAFLRRLVMAAQ